MMNEKLTTTHEIPVDPKKVIISTTDKKGVIISVNDYFQEISGYTGSELLKKPHNIIRHPDMPKIVFKILWDRLHKGENIYAVIKNLTKNGDYYWVVTKFESAYDKDGNIISHTARKKAVPEKVKTIADSIYKTIVAIEKIDPALAVTSFYDILEKYQLTYDDFFLELAEMNEKEVADYFLSEKQNINAEENESILFDLEDDAIERIEDKNTNAILDKDKVLDKIEALKAQIDALKNSVQKEVQQAEISKNNNIEGKQAETTKIDDKELKNLMEALKKKSNKHE